MASLPGRVLFGAAYYHEYQPYERLKTDLDLMAGANFTVIRVGESVWSTWEPEDGRFELDWLRPVGALVGGTRRLPRRERTVRVRRRRVQRGSAVARNGETGAAMIPST
jgi:hypothetical protein